MWSQKTYSASNSCPKARTNLVMQLIGTKKHLIPSTGPQSLICNFKIQKALKSRSSHFRHSWRRCEVSAVSRRSYRSHVLLLLAIFFFFVTLGLILTVKMSQEVKDTPTGSYLFIPLIINTRIYTFHWKIERCLITGLRPRTHWGCYVLYSKGVVLPF